MLKPSPIIYEKMSRVIYLGIGFSKIYRRIGSNEKILADVQMAGIGGHIDEKNKKK